MLSVCMDAKIDQALPPEKEAGGTLYQVQPNAQLGLVLALLHRPAPRLFVAVPALLVLSLRRDL